ARRSAARERRSESHLWRPGRGAAARAAAGAGGGTSAVTGTPGVPASLVRLGRTERFRAAVAVMAPALDASPDEFSGQLVAALAALAQALGRDRAEADWWRLLDALLLVAAHPAAS